MIRAAVLAIADHFSRSPRRKGGENGPERVARRLVGEPAGDEEVCGLAQVKRRAGMTSDSVAPSTWRSAAWARRVPQGPAVAPTMQTGLRTSTSSRRESQS